MKVRTMLIAAASAMVALAAGASAQTVLPGTQPLEQSGDLAAAMVEGIHRYLDKEIQRAADLRGRHWSRDFRSASDYERSVEPNRERLRAILGVVDQRLPVTALELAASTARPARVGTGDGYEILEVRWEVLPGVFGEGLLLQPSAPPVARIVALPDAAWSPEMLAGLDSRLPEEAQFARRLAENGCQVIVPALVDREARWTSLPGIRESNMPHREFLFRMSYELGRHLIGYEVQKILGAVDFFERSNQERRAPVGVLGYGEGGLLALYAAALDSRIGAAGVSGYFQERENLWQETIDRSVWGLLREFGDAEIASLVAPRKLIIETSAGPEVSGPPAAPTPRADRAASGRLEPPPIESARRELERLRPVYEQLEAPQQLALVGSERHPGTDEALRLLLGVEGIQPLREAPRQLAPSSDPVVRIRRQFDQITAFNQRLVRDSPRVRAAFWSEADNSSVEAWNETSQHYRNYVWDEVIGRLPDPDLPPRPRTRKVFDDPAFAGYEVALDVWDDVLAYGILLVPKHLPPGERRPVVVTQHGLEGRPSEIVDPGTDHRFYHRYGARLAQEGFVVYAPQNPYIGRDRFRQIQRKAHPLQLSLYSFILGQHQQTLRWLKSLPYVDPGRIGFYGLSYGGKTAMRIPPLLADYALSVCSADFNEWVWKNTSVTDRYSYLFTHEYDMLEFNFANVVNYAELATLMAPRPFMVERGHADGVAPDEWVAYEFAKVRRFYTQLGLGDRAEIEFFDGPHTIHGVGTFEFLREHLNWN